MSKSFDLLGNLVIETDSPHVNIDFKNNEIFIDIISDQITKELKFFNTLKLRSLAIKIAKWLNEHNLTATLSYQTQVLAIIGRNAKSSPILSVVSGKNIEIKNITIITNLLRGDTNEI
tara:strand:- start:348 stop:701 length:354 start_codon:yes stop_codon:yes gene_type:complete